MVIFRAETGYPVDGIVKTKETLREVMIYVDKPINLIGFRQSLPYLITERDNVLIEQYEIRHFIEMLFEGECDAFRILNTEEIFVKGYTYEFELLKEAQPMFISKNIVQRLLESSKEIITGLEDPEELKAFSVREQENTFLLEQIGYNNKKAYSCIRDMMLVKQLVKDSKFKLTEKQKLTLQGIMDGAFSLGAIKKAYENYKKDIEVILENEGLRDEPSHSQVNKLLLNIRNAEAIFR